MVIRITDRKILIAIWQGRGDVWRAAEDGMAIPSPGFSQGKTVAQWNEVFERSDITEKDAETLNHYWKQGYQESYENFTQANNQNRAAPLYDLIDDQIEGFRNQDRLK